MFERRQPYRQVLFQAHRHSVSTQIQLGQLESESKRHRLVSDRKKSEQPHRVPVRPTSVYAHAKTGRMCRIQKPTVFARTRLQLQKYYTAAQVHAQAEQKSAQQKVFDQE